MNELIKIEEGESGKRTVNARGLWEFLGSKQDFSNWVKNRIAKYNFQENQDFVTINKKVGRQIWVEYHISIDMAKEISMVERNAKGREARLYFIACENKLKAITAPQLPTHLETAKLLVTALETIEADKPKVEYFDNVSETKTLFSMNTVAKLIGWGRNKLFAFLRNDSILMKGNTPYQHYIDAGYFETKEYIFGLHGQYTATTTFVTGKGRQWLFNRYGQ